jgi:hypothetical protein
MRTLICLFGAVFCSISNSFGNHYLPDGNQEGSSYLIFSSLCEHLATAANNTAIANDDTALANEIIDFPDKFFNKLNNKTANLNDKLVVETEKYLRKLEKQEGKLKRKLGAFDSTAAQTVLSVNPNEQYNAIAQKLKSVSSVTAAPSSGDYLANTDSLQTALNFFIKNPKLLSNAKTLPQLQNSLKQLQILQGKMQLADQLKQAIAQRKEQIRQYLSRFTNLPGGISKIYQDYNKQLFYYKQQVSEYKDMFNDPDKMMKKALMLANKIPAFSSFMKSNSMLAGLFNLSGDYDPTTPGQGMPTRDMVMAAFGGQSGLSSQKLQGIVQQNEESASGQIDELKNKFSGAGGGSSDLDVPNFKPSSQKTKSFLKRLELGTNIQTVRSNYYFPATTDLGLSLGYKLDDKNVIGIGVSYKIEWGTGFDHIRLASQGIGLRSFVDINIRKNIFISGGFEYNYAKPFDNIMQLQNAGDWQKSGLLGIGKIISPRTRAVKKTKIQILWNFLSYHQNPPTQPFIYRIGYSF